MSVSIEEYVFDKCKEAGGEVVFIDCLIDRDSRYLMYFLNILKDGKYTRNTLSTPNDFLEMSAFDWGEELNSKEWEQLYERVIINEKLYKEFLVERTLRAL